MGAGISLVGDMQTSGLLLFAGVNIVVFTQLIGQSISHYLKVEQENINDHKTNEYINIINLTYKPLAIEFANIINSDFNKNPINNK